MAHSYSPDYYKEHYPMPESLDIRFLLDIAKNNYSDTASFTASFTARVVYMDPKGERGVLNFLDSDFNYTYPKLPFLADLTITAQADTDRSSDSWYGTHVCYSQPYRVDLPSAQKMTKTLTKIDRALNVQASRFGYSYDSITTLGRVADTLKIRAFGWRVENSTYCWTDLDGLRHYSDTKLDALRGVSK